MAMARALVDGAGTGLRGLIDLLMPPGCIACKAPVATALTYCAECWSALPALAGASCQCCGIPLPLAYQTETLCLGCMKDPPAFDRARAPFLYDGPARHTVLAFKNGREAYAGAMVPQMLRAAADLAGPDVLVVPVPLHPWRLMARGYNQAALLARAVAARSGATLALDALVRVKNTPHSQGMRRDQRRRNVEGAFRVPAPQRSQVRGAHVLLVDDVMTSGATASACARVLRRAGATHIDVITYARVAATDVPTYSMGLESQDSDGEG
jgi:ComF family protein